jgi:hypothetical protein
MRKLLLNSCLVLALLVVGAHTALAQTDTTTVNYSVAQVSLVDIAASNVALNITTGVAGTGLTDATANTTYAITNNASNQKITGQINSNMPSNTTLLVDITAPGSGSSAGAQSMTTSAADLVTGIGAVNTSGVAIDFTLQATVTAGIVSSSSKTLTLTITAGT